MYTKRVVRLLEHGRFNESDVGDHVTFLIPPVAPSSLSFRGINILGYRIQVSRHYRFVRNNRRNFLTLNYHGWLLVLVPYPAI